MSESLSLAQCLALKLMPDVRYYDTGQGREPVLALPEPLAAALAALQPCGVILFRENLASVGQCRELTSQLRAVLGPGALIGIDQEGGRVTRLPRAEVTSFSGSMALAACRAAERGKLAEAMGAAQAAELRALGINVNFAPSLDVNSNPDNPVIHVRAFGDDPKQVAQLGAAVVRGLQGGSVAAAVKHFPGHGDTADDSHTGLPRVRRDHATALAVDVAPFADVIREASPAMVMTAHIQYPSLDPETLPDTDFTCPATLSRPILTGLLRDTLGFSGVIITDALDMRAISDRLSAEAAVEACFRAGADIALMPVLVRDAASLQCLQALVPHLVDAVRDGRLVEAEIRASAARIQALQARYALAGPVGEHCVGCAAHRALEQRIAAGSITRLHGEPWTLAPDDQVYLLMPDRNSAAAMATALREHLPDLAITAHSLEDFDAAREQAGVAAAGTVLVGVSEPVNSAVAVGGAEDLGALADRSPAAAQQWVLQAAAGRRRAVIMLFSPYPAPAFYPDAEAVYATFDGAAEGYGGAPGPAYRALAAVLCGRATADGELPVRLAPA
jgi:beta-N-acetylhexosaminidase